MNKISRIKIRVSNLEISRIINMYNIYKTTYKR